jgi:hypothetical protein
VGNVDPSISSLSLSSTLIGLGRLTSFNSCPSSSSELIRDLSLKLELTLSKDSRVMISSLVDAAIGSAVRIEVSELFAGDEMYRLGKALEPPPVKICDVILVSPSDAGESIVL